jgi:hypothetical protein
VDPKERGTQFIDDFVKNYPEEIRAELKEKLLAQEAGLVYAGEHALRQDEFSRGMNDNKVKRENNEAWHRDLATWKARVDTELAEGKAAKERLAAMGASGGGMVDAGQGGQGGEGGEGDGGGAGNGSPGGAPDLTGFVKKEDVQSLIKEAVTNVQSQSFNTSAYMSQLQVAHLKEFDDVLDTSALIAHCRETNQPVDRGGYESFVKAKRDETQKTKHEAELKAARDEGREAMRAELSSAPPYPVTPGSGGADSSTLAGLKMDKDAKTGAVAAAVKTYHEEIQKRVVPGSG